MNLPSRIRFLSFRETLLRKQAQDRGFSGTLSDIAKPVLFGVGGYAASRALGGEERTGVPDWLLGPAVGIGAAMPLTSAVGRGIQNYRLRRQAAQADEEQQAQLEHLLEQEREMRQQMNAPYKEMLQQLVGYQMGIPMDAYGTKMGQLRIPLQQADQIATTAQQNYQQGQVQQTQQQMQNAAVAQAVKAQMRGAAQAQQTAARKQTAAQMGAR